jgi:hypothetical protein
MPSLVVTGKGRGGGGVNKPNTVVVARGRRGKDDRKQNTLAQLGNDNQEDLEIDQAPVGA